uniref:GST N-terminal domain-containing protein n=1 Tax=Trypanosoma congolense (strain IL3000) TaxID=1068625 RepID=G0UN52_TRYCI|nr:conserved hypothetical protein [Trypanosoma congolense IL3000]
MVLALVGSYDDHNVHRILLVAAFAGTKLKLVPITAGTENVTNSYRLNCHPLGQMPVLKSDEGYLFGTNAIIRHLARTERPYDPLGSVRYPSPEHTVPYTLYGKSELELAMVDCWLDFVVMRLDPHVLRIMELERLGRGRQRHEDLEEARDAVMEALHTLEERLRSQKKQLEGVLGNCTPKTNGKTAADEADAYLSEEESLLIFTPRGTTCLRGCHTYNIKSRAEEQHETGSIFGNSPPDGAGVGGASTTWQSLCTVRMPTPRGNIATPRHTQMSPHRNSVPPTDTIFIVGDSLTAADLILAMAISLALKTKLLPSVMRKKCPTVVHYSTVIMRLPVAANVQKALKIDM